MEKYFSGLGRRKTASAQVRVTAGSGKVVVNGKPVDEFFTTDMMRRVALRPLQETGKAEAVDVSVKTIGGGIMGQADAVRMGIARALVKMDEAMKPALKAAHMLTRDPRKKERKKPGKHGARTSPQWRKR